MKIRVGRYVMREAVLTIWLDTDTGDGNTRFAWEDEGFITVAIGTKQRSWGQMVATLLHELYETAFVLFRVQYQPATVLTHSTSAMYVMMFNHEQFSEMCEQVGDVVQYAVPDMKRAAAKGNAKMFPRRKKGKRK